jgi:hypothetical protein
MKNRCTLLAKYNIGVQEGHILLHVIKITLRLKHISECFRNAGLWENE